MRKGVLLGFPLVSCPFPIVAKEISCYDEFDVVYRCYVFTSASECGTLTRYTEKADVPVWSVAIGMYNSTLQQYRAYVSAFPQDGASKKVAILEAQGYTAHFDSNLGKLFDVNPADVLRRKTMPEVWSLLLGGTVDAVYTGETEATVWLGSSGHDAKYHRQHFAEAGSNGVAYGCRPEFGDVVASLNAGLQRLKNSSEWEALCSRYPTIPCDRTDSGAFVNQKQTDGVGMSVATHPYGRADIVIGTEADWGDYNKIVGGVLGGFDIELTEAVCRHAGKTCAIITVPWQSVWPRTAYAELGWPKNALVYPGEGMNNQWFHCSSGTRNTLQRQQSTAFTDAYTDKSKDYAGFVTSKDLEAVWPGSTRKVPVDFFSGVHACCIVTSFTLDVKKHACGLFSCRPTCPPCAAPPYVR